MLAAATSAASAFFKASTLAQNYVYTQAGSSPSFSGTSSPAPPASNHAPFTAGLWRVQEAVHKTTGKRVSVWTFDTRKNSALERLAPQARERVVEVLKAEASALTRLRHPCILEVAEPLEETRSDLSFATEPVSSTLAMAIPGSSPGTSHSDPIDEIEIRKGVLQLSKGLAFLHTSARLVHTNMTPESILINAAGDWKISGLGLTIPLLGPDGNPTRWEFPSYDVRAPPSTQRSFDYIAPEYALREQIATASDMYSLGCVIYAVHAKGFPPFKNHNSLTSMRSNLGRLEGGGGIPNTAGWDGDLTNLVTSLVTPNPMTRLAAETLPSHGFFSSTAVSTLNFLDPSTFAPKPREEKIAFMKGLQTVLPRFSEGMKRRKILPSILTEMKDPLLLPSILPNVFNISSTLDATQFQELILPSLKPLFALRDPPQNMIVLLENLGELQQKTSQLAFRQDVLPLVYNALMSEHAAVQERALQAIPHLCDTIDYAEVQNSLFPRAALVFTKTHILSVKVATLQCFLGLVKTLDQASLTQKLVPLLSRIKTKEPSVMLATLAVHEAMGRKVDREAVALLVLPQLWQMSVGPLLNVEQFQRFMVVIRALTDRVEKEHSQHLRDAQRVEDRSALANSSVLNLSSDNTDFAKLVGAGTVRSPSTNSVTSTSNGNSLDDVWGRILDDESPGQLPSTLPPLSNAIPEAQHTQSLPGSPLRGPIQLAGRSSIVRTLGARQIAPSSNPTTPRITTPSPASPFPSLQPPRFHSASTVQTIPNPTSSTPQQTKPVTLSALSSSPLLPASQPMAFFTPLQPQSLNTWSQPSITSTTTKSSGPNYNIALEPANLRSPSVTAANTSPPLFSNNTIDPQTPSQLQRPPAFPPPLPLQPQQRRNLPNSTGKSSLDFAGFDPLL